MSDEILPILLAAIIVSAVAGIIAYRGVKQQEANLLAFAIALGGLLGWSIGAAIGIPQFGSGFSVVIGFLCVLPARTFKVHGRRPAMLIGIGWILVAMGWIGWIVVDSFMK